MEKQTFKVPSIHCEHCVHTIEMELGDLEGVKNVKADLEHKTVEVEYEAPATKELIVGTLKEINYPPEM
jgi:copper chaperone